MSEPDRKKPVRGPIAWMAGRSVTANLLMLVLLIGGIFMAGQIKKDVFPDFELDLVTVSIAYPGASPEEVERGTIFAIEEAVADLEGIKQVTSFAREGSGSVTIEINEGDIKHAIIDLYEELEELFSK